jgi:murein L,D-transpeptidase YcbB/YkuD
MGSSLVAAQQSATTAASPATGDSINNHQDGAKHSAEPGAKLPEPAEETGGASSQPGETTQPTTPTPDAPQQIDENAAEKAEAVAPTQAERTDPLIAAVRQSLTGGGWPGEREGADLAALVEFYAAPNAQSIWVDEKEFTAKAKSVMQEIGKADDWGLDADDFKLPAADLAQSTIEERAAAEIKVGLAVLKYVHQARGGRAVPSRISRQIDQHPELKEPATVLAEITKADDAAQYLREQHPQHPQFEKLRQALIKLRDERKPDDEVSVAERVKLPDGPLLRPGSEHPHVALLRRRLEVPAESGAEERFDEELEEAVREFQRARGLTADGLVGRGTRAVLNGEQSGRAERASARAEQRLIVNMERWRWMPRDLGAFHVLNNIPEYRTRVFKNRAEVFSERIIVGKTDARTPAFSANMKYVIFHPSWGVPNGIKRTEILPYLKQKTGLFGLGGSDTRILSQHNLSVSYQGRPVDASQINWTSSNIVDYDFVQPPGPMNVLGRVKFRFPNDHDVYMHDTPERELFAQSYRALSHGCMRVRNPRRLAEVLLQEDKGWSPEEVGQRWSGALNGHVELEHAIPVHTAYFTAYVTDAGEVEYFPDVYGYDARTARAINGDAEVFEGERIPQGPPPARRVPPSIAQKGPETVADLISGFLSN